MLRTLALIAAFALVSASADAAPNCKKGKACGNTCIAMDKECHMPGAKMDAGPYKLDAKGNCHDAKGKMSKKEMCAAK